MGVTSAIMPAGWLQNYINAIQTPSAFENKKNVTRFNLREYSREYFQPKIYRKITIFNLG